MHRWRYSFLLSLLSLGFQFQAVADTAQSTIGERFFLETRFAQFFSKNFDGNVNDPLVAGDPTVDTSVTMTGSLPGPFAGQSMNCRACHMVDEQNAAAGNRTYDDFARRSPIPAREDGRTLTVRNSPPMVNSTITRSAAMFLHFDGQFRTIQDLVKTTYVGRNYGWLQNERTQAVAHIAKVVREDDGSGALAADYGNFSYKALLKGTDKKITSDLSLPKEFRIDVDTATDEQVLTAVSKLVGAYVDSLLFAQDNFSDFVGSPYDAFLVKNSLPRKPSHGETDIAYARRLRALVLALDTPKFVKASEGKFEFHDQPFVFGQSELRGLKLFMNKSNCFACHAPPNFTDFKFHNTGAAQEEYDAVYGKGSFAQLHIPSLVERNANADIDLPPSPTYPLSPARFESIPDAATPGLTDLGVWNVLFNPSNPNPQSTLKKIFCSTGACTKALMLQRSIATFKTPGLRDLADGAPYLHTGRKDTIEDVVGFYVGMSKLSRAKQVRNVDPEIRKIEISTDDVTPLVNFLRSLTEDYS